MCERPRVGGLMACACVAPVLKPSTCNGKASNIITEFSYLIFPPYNSDLPVDK
jgi:hypothetical protein